MKTYLSFSNPAQLETECLALVVLNQAEGEKAEPVPALQTSDQALQDAARELMGSGELSGKIFETVMLHHPRGLKARRLLFIGGGKAKNFTSYELRKLAGTAVRFLKPKGIRSFAFLMPDWTRGRSSEALLSPQENAKVSGQDALSRADWTRGRSSEALLSPHENAALLSAAHENVKSVVEGAFVGNFDPDIYKSDRKEELIQELTILAPEKFKTDGNRLQSALEQARIIGESQNFARELVNEPGNRMTPAILGRRAAELVRQIAERADGFRITCEIYGADKIKELKMGAFWSVAQGSDEPPALIVIKYDPVGAPEKPVIGLVGKGITFDSGGISIKPSDGMEKMKYDMAGGAAMLGAMRAIALLKPRVKVIAIVLATENMPSGKAQKPGDVQIAMSGKSIEIINTDAEGRLVLADGLHYARHLGCTHLVDAATLTGACVVALGMVNAGIFSNDEQMFARFRSALRRSGEKMWRLPIDEEYKEMIRSNIADMVNSGGRYGGAVTAAMFLHEFVEGTPWIHLDIAGTAWMEENKSWIAKGPSGIAVRSLVEFVRGFDGGE